MFKFMAMRKMCDHFVNRNTLSTVVVVNGMTRAVNIATFEAVGQQYVITNLLTGEVVKVFRYVNPLNNALFPMWVRTTVQIACELAGDVEHNKVHHLVVQSVVDGHFGCKAVMLEI